jgi:hypothetical protein
MNVKYMLRRTLCPWKIEELVEETIAYCRKSSIDEIIWITESSGRYKELLPIEGIRDLMPGLRYAKEKTEEAGITYSINPLTTIGHGDYGNDVRAIHPDMDFMVDFTGKNAKSAACPLSPYWRELMLETYRLYAETRPARLWIEDDFRYISHGSSIAFGCYCDLHLKEFSNRTGKKFSREELVAKLLTPGKLDPVRKEWFAFLSDTLCEVAGMIAGTVHSESPDTVVSLMSPNPSAIDNSGVDFGKLTAACSDGRVPGIRMSSTRFQERNARDVMIVDENMKRFIPNLPENTLRCTEVETCPHSLYSKSVSGIAAQIEWATILNVPNHTLNIFDYIGSPMNLVPKYGEMLRKRKKEFESFGTAFEDAEYNGVGILYRPVMPDSAVASEGKSMVELAARECGFADSIRAFGIPVVFGKDAEVTAVTGQSLRAFGRTELEKIFSKGVLLDGFALGVLKDLGLSELAGAEIKSILPRRSMPVGPEELTDPDFGGGGKYLYTWTLGLWPEYMLEAKPGARMISRIVDLNGEYLMPGFVLYENRLGGRVAVCPYNLGGTGLDPYLNREPVFYYSEYRKRQIREVVRWLGRGSVPLIVEADGWILPHRADAPSRILAAAMNVSDDGWKSVVMKISTDKDVKKVRWAGIDGKWKNLPRASWKQKNGEVTINVSAEIPPRRMVAAEISLK